MKLIRIIAPLLILSSLSSCSLIGGLLKLPGSILKTVGRTAGVSALTDESPAPVEKTPSIGKPEQSTTPKAESQ